jgi:hypothetical protein
VVVAVADDLHEEDPDGVVIDTRDDIPDRALRAVISESELLLKVVTWS